MHFVVHYMIFFHPAHVRAPENFGCSKFVVPVRLNVCFQYVFTWSRAFRSPSCSVTLRRPPLLRQAPGWQPKQRRLELGDRGVRAGGERRPAPELPRVLVREEGAAQTSGGSDRLRKLLLEIRKAADVVLKGRIGQIFQGIQIDCHRFEGAWRKRCEFKAAPLSLPTRSTSSALPLCPGPRTGTGPGSRTPSAS